MFALTGIFHIGYIPSVEWEVEFTDEFGDWWNSLSEAEQEDVNAKVILVRRSGGRTPARLLLQGIPT